MRLRRCMVEKDSALSGELSYIECILHQQEDIHIGRFPLGAHERSEHHEAPQLAGADSQTINSSKPLCYRDPLP